MGFFKRKDGGADNAYQDWKDLETGWGKTKFIGREIKTLIGFIVFVVLFFYLISL